MYLVPISLEQAKFFIYRHHRHNKAVTGWKFGVGIKDDSTEDFLGVGVASRPIARANDNGITLELTRVCTLGAPNVNSILYGTLIKAGRALGYTRFITYTLTIEQGSSLRAVGFKNLGEIRSGGIWTGFLYSSQDLLSSRDIQASVTAPKQKWELIFPREEKKPNPHNFN